MAQHRLLWLLALVALGIKSCCSQDSELLTPKIEEGTQREVEDNSRYKSLEANATLMKLLVNDKGGVSRTEVFDMLHSRDDKEDHVDLPTFPEDEEDKPDYPIAPDAQAELLQAGVTVNKDAQRMRFSNARVEPVGTAAGIMILVTCSIVCLAYTALIVWRRIYIIRNGLKHELLRNEEAMAETRIEM